MATIIRRVGRWHLVVVVMVGLVHCRRCGSIRYRTVPIGQRRTVVVLTDRWLLTSRSIPLLLFRFKRLQRSFERSALWFDRCEALLLNILTTKHLIVVGRRRTHQRGRLRCTVPSVPTVPLARRYLLQQVLVNLLHLPALVGSLHIPPVTPCVRFPFADHRNDQRDDDDAQHRQQDVRVCIVLLRCIR
uniref:Putative secreted protein n=1 Tax=Anopheles triannulatus TaxID=58253 RepID=A0A2M4B2B7_9DIPT